ncbi:MAG: hypothetical protein ACKER6_01165, partial [Candidatus Hodgkinia cicadicola]
SMASLCRTAIRAKVEAISRVVARGQLTSGIVCYKDCCGALLNIGRESLGWLPNLNSWSFQQLQIGSSVEAYVEEVGIAPLPTILSRRHLDAEAAWNAVFEAWKANEPVGAEVIAVSIRGVEMRVFGLPSGLVWDSEAARRAQDFKRNEIVPVRIAWANQALNIIVLAPLGPPSMLTEPFRTNEALWAEFCGYGDRCCWLDVCGRSVMLKFEGVPWLEALRFVEGTTFEQLVIVNARRQLIVQPEEAPDMNDLFQMSTTLIEDMVKADRKLASDSEMSLRSQIETKLRYALTHNNWEVDRLEREWATAERAWNIGMQTKLLAISSETAVWKRESARKAVQAKKDADWPVWSAEDGQLDELEWINPPSPFKSHQQMSTKQLNCQLHKQNALICGLEQVKWLNYLKAEILENCVTQEKETKDSDWNDEWDEHEMFYPENDQSDVAKPPVVIEEPNGDWRVEGEDLASWAADGLAVGEDDVDEPIEETKTGNETDESGSWKHGLDIEKLWLIGKNVFNNIERNQLVIEANLFVGASDRPTRSLRPVYGSLYGWDLESNLLVIQVSEDLIVQIADASFTIEDTYLLQRPRPDCVEAIKVLPVAFCPAVGAMLVEIDVEGLRILRFVDANGFGPFEGTIVKVESDCLIISLPEGMWGKLCVQGEYFSDCECVGSLVSVNICDINVMSNTIYLDLYEDEEACTLLVEANV